MTDMINAAKSRLSRIERQDVLFYGGTVGMVATTVFSLYALRKYGRNMSWRYPVYTIGGFGGSFACTIWGLKLDPKNQFGIRSFVADLKFVDDGRFGPMAKQMVCLDQAFKKGKWPFADAPIVSEDQLGRRFWRGYLDELPPEARQFPAEAVHLALYFGLLPSRNPCGECQGWTVRESNPPQRGIQVEMFQNSPEACERSRQAEARIGEYMRKVGPRLSGKLLSKFYRLGQLDARFWRREGLGESVEAWAVDRRKFRMLAESFEGDQQKTFLATLPSTLLARLAMEPEGTLGRTYAFAAVSDDLKDLAVELLRNRMGVPNFPPLIVNGEGVDRLSQLPDDLFTVIGKFLDRGDLLALRQTGKTVCKKVSKPAVWDTRRFDFSAFDFWSDLVKGTFHFETHAAKVRDLVDLIVHPDHRETVLIHIQVEENVLGQMEREFAQRGLREGMLLLL